MYVQTFVPFFAIFVLNNKNPFTRKYFYTERASVCLNIKMLSYQYRNSHYKN